MARKKIKSIEITADSNREFFLIHGYTGSPTNFDPLLYQLNKKFNANVRVILLPGHGTKISDLDKVTYEDFMGKLTEEVGKDIKKGREIILGGVSLGGIFSLILASQYPVKGVFDVGSPYNLKFPFNIHGIEMLGKFKKYWKKRRKSFEEAEARKGLFSYAYMHINGLSIVKQASRELRKNIKNITCPVLTIHSTRDPIGHYSSLKEIQNNVSSVIKESKMFSTKTHNEFFSTDRDEINNEIINFIEKKNIFFESKKLPKKVAAIIPAYNEAERIESVLKAIASTENIDEIIVVDDGSTDSTEEIVKKFKNVKYIRNNINIGKAGSMDRGVQSTDADILFFCDADLIGITPEIISQIIRPVVDEEFSMFIGIRGNLMQKTIHLFAINSGERVLTREVWKKLPQYFKYKYRVEAGLNYYVKKYFNGFGFKVFNYSQPTKEKKYGFVRGTILRWGMNLDVLLAYSREIFEESLGNSSKGND